MCGAFFCFSAQAFADASEVVQLDPIVTEDTRVEGGETTAELVRAHAVDTHQSGAATSLGDVFRGDAALRVSENGGRLQPQNVSMRGSASQDVLVTYHGITLNALSHASADLSLIPARLLSRVNVKPNAGSEHDGSGALGGSIELQSGFADHAFESLFSVGSLGDYAILGRKNVMSERVSADFAVFADKSLGRFDYVDAQGSEQTREHNAAWRLGGQADALVDAGWATVEAFVFYAMLSREVAGMSEFPDAFREANEASQTALAAVEATSQALEVGQSDATLHFVVNHRYAQDDYKNPSSFLGNRDYHTRYDENRTHAATDAQFLYGAWETDLSLAYEYQHVKTRRQIVPDDVQTHNARHIASLVVEQKAAFWDERLHAFAGLRTDYVSGDGLAFSPRLAVDISPLSWLAINASGAYATRYPAFDELYLQTEGVQGDPDLKKQTSVLTDLTLVLTLEPWFSLQVEGFYNLHRDLIRFVPITSYAYKAKNLSPSTSRGVDLRAKFHYEDYLSVEAGYAFNDAFIDQGRLPIVGIPRHQVVARISGRYDLFSAWLQATYSAKIATKLSGQYLRTNPFKLDAHVAFDLFGHYLISLDVKNLLNDRTTEDLRQYPLPGISAMLNFEIQY